MLVLGDPIQAILAERKEWAVLENVTAIFAIKPCFLVGRTGWLVQLGSRLNHSVKRGRDGRSFNRGVIRLVILENDWTFYIVIRRGLLN
jgi:hypothetical protein